MRGRIKMPGSARCVQPGAGGACAFDTPATEAGNAPPRLGGPAAIPVLHKPGPSTVFCIPAVRLAGMGNADPGAGAQWCRTRTGRGGGDAMAMPAGTDAVRSGAGVWVDDAQLRIEVERAAAAAGVTVEGPMVEGGGVGSGPSESDWARCPTVVLDPHAAEACVAARLPRRRAVLLVCAPESAGAGVWQRAVRLGADDVFLLPEDADSLLAAFHRHSGARRRGRGGVITVV